MNEVNKDKIEERVVKILQRAGAMNPGDVAAILAERDDFDYFKVKGTLWDMIEERDSIELNAKLQIQPTGNGDDQSEQ